MDLQLFSEERTEEATPRQLRKAREEGRAPRSSDLVAGIGLVAATMGLQALGPSIYEQLAQGMVKAFTNLTRQELTPDEVGHILEDWALIFLKAAGPITLVILAVGVAVGFLQSGFLVATKTLVPDFGRINPASGLSRMFSLRTVVELVKGLLKLSLVGFIAYRDFMDILPQIPTLLGQSVALGIGLVADKAVSGLQTIGYGLLALGIFDYGYQYWEFRKSLRMTKEEVKKEHKEQEGSPEVKQRRTQRARELSRRRKALKDVPLADVVVTNPTHFAVAIKYSEEEAAPKVIAKGTDLLAQRIKVIAKQNEIPMVENRPLARNLYAMVEVGKTIPPELYQAVAEVLAFVYSLRRQQRRDTM